MWVCNNAKYCGKEIRKEKHVRVHLVMPKSLYDRLDKYCNSVMKGKFRIRSAIIRNAIEEFLDKHKGNNGSS